MKSFEVFFRNNYQLVVSVVQNRLGPSGDVEEIVASAFQVAWQHYERGNELSVPWLYGVVRNLVGNEYRRRDRSIALVEKLTSEAQVASSAVESEVNLVRDALDTLPEAQREILIMAYWDELTPDEIARVLSISTGNARVRLTRARKVLRTAIDQLRERVEG